MSGHDERIQKFRITRQEMQERRKRKNDREAERSDLRAHLHVQIWVNGPSGHNPK